LFQILASEIVTGSITLDWLPTKVLKGRKREKEVGGSEEMKVRCRLEVTTILEQ
jgi:hypothetical protein